MKISRTAFLSCILLAGLPGYALSPSLEVAAKNLGVGIDVGYRYEEFRNAREHQLAHANSLGFTGSMLFGLVRAGVGFEIGFANPEGRILRDSVSLENRNIATSKGYLESGLVIPLKFTYLEPFVRLGYSTFSVVVDNGPPAREYELGGSSYLDFGARTIVSWFRGDDGLIGIGLAAGRRNYLSGNPHYSASAWFAEASFSATGWLLHGK
jgi:hypothetical protein